MDEIQVSKSSVSSNNLKSFRANRTSLSLPSSKTKASTSTDCSGRDKAPWKCLSDASNARQNSVNFYVVLNISLLGHFKFYHISCIWSFISIFFGVGFGFSKEPHKKTNQPTNRNTDISDRSLQTQVRKKLQVHQSDPTVLGFFLHILHCCRMFYLKKIYKCAYTPEN